MQRRTLLLAALALPLVGWASTASETLRIQGLIDHIAGLNGAQLLRNGDAHSPSEAAAHLTMKWKKAGSRVVTAEDFVRLCATQSYLSGQPYQLRLANGQTLAAGPYLLAVLKRQDAARLGH